MSREQLTDQIVLYAVIAIKMSARNCPLHPDCRLCYLHNDRLQAENFTAIAAQYVTTFTAGGILSVVADIYISVARYWYLRKLKEGYTV